MKYNKNSQLGILNGDRLVEVKFTVNKGNAFGNLIRVRFIEGDRLIGGRLIEF